MVLVVSLAIVMSLVGLFFSGFLVYRILKQDTGSKEMRVISDAITQGAKAFLNRQYKTIAVITMVLAVVFAFTLGVHGAITFVIGAVLSAVSGYVGMHTSVRANVRTAQAATRSLGRAFSIAFQGGAVTGIALMSLGLLGITVLYLVYGEPEILIGFGFGASLISLFARVGGGIYTKGADVGADLVGKVEKNIPEDDPRNPAVIADNVGDNVGDCAGMAADLFESFTVTLIATMILGAVLLDDSRAVLYPLLLSGIALVASIVATFFVKARVESKIWSALNRGILISSLLSAFGFFVATYYLFDGALEYFWAALIGIVLTVLISYITDYYTSSSRKPVKEITKTTKTGSATTIISGLATGFEATVLPIIILILGIFFSYSLAGYYGVSIASMAMLSMSGIIVAVDAFGPITDNAGGIAEMSRMPSRVRKTTDALDAVGNTTKAVTKGFAIISAGLAALSLFAAYSELSGIATLDLFSREVVIGLFIGGMLPFLFSSLTMKAVGKAATLMVEEVRRQFKSIPGLMEGKAKPNYAKCVDISTKAAIKELIIPGIIAVLAPVIVGFVLGPEALGGLLAGVIVTGLLLALTMTTAGAAWDNSKKLIETGVYGGKGSDPHKAAVVGDTVGDPFKDTSGPALNPLIKVINTIALLIAVAVTQFNLLALLA